MTFLAYYPDKWHASTEISKSLNINPVLVRKELKSLKDHNLIESKEGKNGGIQLMRKAENIYLSDIFIAVKGSNHLLNLSNNVPDVSCKIGGQINEKLLVMFDDMDNAITNTLKNQTLEGFKNQF